ncbi:C40 family peptidase [Flexivirga meconopsidis]|uniref:C40 family peptidase n=1 Tax=Flexivirga meconopsidis TaxID=2977121 RepID=UPI00223E9FD4|nr:NlpC/P60 family protein [Flexivirga meconopsidis]
MGSYSPRHLKQQPTALNKMGRRGIAFAAAGAVVVPLAGMETASAAPGGTLVQAGAVKQAGAIKATPAKAGPTVYWGSRGTAVKVVQSRLGGLAVDGIFGPLTNRAVRNYQRSHGLVVDGIVGPRTWASLGGYGGGGGTAPKPAPRSTSGVTGIALSLQGVPYRWGGNTPSGFDCSGFTSYVFARAGKSIPRTASQQAYATTRVSNPQPGDLVFWGYPAYHVAIYLGNGKIIAARKPGTVVSVQNLWGSYYFGRA